MPDKRAAPRRDTMYYLEVKDARSGALVGRVVDISDGGVLLICERPPEPGARIAARIVVPEDVYESSGIACVLTVRWRRPDYNPDFTLVGCRMEVGPEELDAVYAVIARYSFNDV